MGAQARGHNTAGGVEGIEAIRLEGIVALCKHTDAHMHARMQSHTDQLVEINCLSEWCVFFFHGRPINIME